MVKVQPRVLMSNYYDRSVIANALASLKQWTEVIDGNRNRNYTLAEIRQALEGVQAVIAADEPYSREVFAGAEDLLLVARDGAGYDKIDLEAATEYGVVVTRAPVVIDATANLTIGLMIAMVRQIPFADRAIREGRWMNRSAFLCPDLTGLTLGVVGFGQVGYGVAVRAKALGMRVMAYDSADVSARTMAVGAEVVSLEELLIRSDVVSVHLSHTPATRGMFETKMFGKMKKGCYFINTSRGEIVNEANMIEALQSGHLAGAGLDVFGQEPIDIANPLLSMSNVVLSPHLAGDTATTMIKATEMNVAQIEDLFSGKQPANMLNPDVWPNARIQKFLRLE